MVNNTFYDLNPFKYGYSSKEGIILNMHHKLKRVIEENKSGVICDIGCGCGRNLLYSVKYANTVIGIDLSKESLKFANQFINSNKLELIVGDNLNIPLHDDFTDLVISDGVAHHTGNAIRAFQECIRILKPNGLLYLAIYKKWRYYSFLYKYMGGVFRIMSKNKIGRSILKLFIIPFYYLLYRIFKSQQLNFSEIRNIFYDYFITPIASFHSRLEVLEWIENNKCALEYYDRTNGNCHVFLIRKLWKKS